MNLNVSRVMTWHQAKELRLVRNSCREGMTHNTAEISEAEQWRFWEDHLLAPEPVYHAYLFYDGAKPFAYGMLRRDLIEVKFLDRDAERFPADAVWMTYGMVPEYRGRGWSRSLIQWITQVGYLMAPEVWIDVWDDNFALRSDIREGYEFVDSVPSEGRTLHVMKHRRNRALGEREAERLGEYRGTVREMLEVDEITREAYA